MIKDTVLYSVGQTCYVDSEAFDYVENLCPKVSHLCGHGEVIVKDVYNDSGNPEDAVYDVHFLDDDEEIIFELYHFETRSTPLQPLPYHPIQSQIEMEYDFDEFKIVPNDIIDNYFESKGKELGALVDRKQKAYGNAVDQTYKVIRVFMESYQNEDGSYTIPESLLKHLLLQVRIIDKQNRIFNNPNGDLMSESPYGDLSGYGLLGQSLGEEK